MSRPSRLLTVLGALGVALSVVLLTRGELSLPTRHPPVAFHLRGASLLWLAAAPALVGAVLIGLGRGLLHRQSAVVRALVLGAIVATMLAFILAPRH